MSSEEEKIAPKRLKVLMYALNFVMRERDFRKFAKELVQEELARVA